MTHIDLVPHHKISFDTSRISLGSINLQPQRILFVTKEPLKEGTPNAALDIALKEIKALAPGLEITVAALDEIPEKQFTGVLVEDDSLLNDAVTKLKERWETNGEPLDGVLYHAFPHTLQDKTPTPNSEHVVLLPIPEGECPIRWAARLAALVANHAHEPARPFTTLPLGTTTHDNFKRDERSKLLKEGVSTWTKDEQGNVRIERLVTTRTKGESGGEDTSYQNLPKRLVLSALKYDLYHYFSRNFSRKMLANDGATGANILTPSTAKQLALSRYDAWTDLGWVQPSPTLAKETTCHIHPQDPSRLVFRLPVDLMGQLYSTETTVSFL